MFRKLILFASLALPLTAQAGDKTLWDEWYTMTINGKIHYGYYNEHVEKRKDHLFFKNDVWKREEDYINREALGAEAQDDEKVSPLFFNFHSTYRTNETTIDGNVQGTMLTVKAKRTDKDYPVSKRGIPSKTILATFFPVWLGRHLPALKDGRVLDFTTVMEDNIELAWSPVEGHVKLEKPDELAKKTRTTKVSVDYGSSHTVWWVDERGCAWRIEMPEQKVVVERATKNTAIRFLEHLVEKTQDQE